MSLENKNQVNADEGAWNKKDEQSYPEEFGRLNAILESGMSGLIRHAEDKGFTEIISTLVAYAGGEGIPTGEYQPLYEMLNEFSPKARENLFQLFPAIKERYEEFENDLRLCVLP